MDNGACSYRRYLDGDEEAFDEIMNELFDKLVFFINRYVRDYHAAEDIAMDAFADLIVHKNRYNFSVSLKTYLFMLGRSRALTYLKRQHRRQTIPVEEAETTAFEEGVEADYLRTEQHRAVHEAVERLPSDMCAAVHLVYFEELTYEEAARVMKKNKKQIDNLLYRAKQELRLTLGKEGVLL